MDNKTTTCCFDLIKSKLKKNIVTANTTSENYIKQVMINVETFIKKTDQIVINSLPFAEASIPKYISFAEINIPKIGSDTVQIVLDTSKTIIDVNSTKLDLEKVPVGIAYLNEVKTDTHTVNTDLIKIDSDATVLYNDLISK